VCIALCTIVAHNIAQNRPNNFPTHPPDNQELADLWLFVALHMLSTTRMWANAQRDGRPAEYSWRPLFNAAKYG